MAYKFLTGHEQQTTSEVWGHDTPLPDYHDRRSYCANSDLFYDSVGSLADQKLSEEEYRRQAEYYCS